MGREPCSLQPVGGLAALLLLLPGAPASAQDAETPRAVAVHVERGPVVDGVLDDPVWARAEVHDRLLQVEPDEGASPTQRTEIRILTDRRNLYIGVRCYDSEPDRIVAQRLKRDDFFFFDDRIAIVLDTFHDRRNGFFFQVNPLGGRRDGLIEGSDFDDDWDGIWYAKAQIDAEGWVAELAIPYQTLSYDPDGDVWGFNLTRGIRRHNEVLRWADPHVERDFTNVSNAGLLVGLRGISQGLGLDVAPSLTLRRVDERDPGRHFNKVDPSGNLFYKLASSLTASATVNPDFGASESDELQVNLTRFGLFFPEKRPFFLQDAGIFDFADLDENGLPFFSRRIGLDGEGEEVDVIAGGKLTGRLGPVSIGLLDAQIDDHRGVDGENLAVGRLAVNLLEESKLGGIFTRGNPDSDRENLLGGVDFDYRNSNFFPNRVAAASLWFQRSHTGGATGDEAAWGATLDYPNDIVDWRLQVREFQEDFLPGLGFVNRVDIRDYDGRFRYRVRPERGPLRKVDSELSGRLVTNTGTTVQSGLIRSVPIEIENDVEDQAEIFYEHRFERLKLPFEIRRGIFVPAGTYHFDAAGFEVESSRSRPLQGELFASYGTFFSGERLQVRPELDWRPNAHWLLAVEYEHNEVWLPQGDFATRVARARVEISFTADLFWLNFVQYESVGDVMQINSRLRWIITPGSELFLVFNQTWGSRNGLALERTEPLVRFQWTFRF